MSGGGSPPSTLWRRAAALRRFKLALSSSASRSWRVSLPAPFPIPAFPGRFGWKLPVMIGLSPSARVAGFNFNLPAPPVSSLAFGLARRQALWQCPPARSRSVPTRRPWDVRFFEAFAFSCRSSVVEHSLGKGEVESSIPSGSTSLNAQKPLEIKVSCSVLYAVNIYGNKTL